MKAPVELRALRGSVEWHDREFRRALSGLSTAARESVHPLHWVQAHPLRFAAAALVFGWWLGSRTRR